MRSPAILRRPSSNRRWTMILVGAGLAAWMDLHKQVLGSGGVEVPPVAGAAFGVGVQKQYGSGLRQGPGQVGGQGGLADPTLLVDDCDYGYRFANKR